MAVGLSLVERYVVHLAERPFPFFTAAMTTLLRRHFQQSRHGNEGSAIRALENLTPSDENEPHHSGNQRHDSPNEREAYYKRVDAHQAKHEHNTVEQNSKDRRNQ